MVEDGDVLDEDDVVLDEDDVVLEDDYDGHEVAEEEGKDYVEFLRKLWAEESQILRLEHIKVYIYALFFRF